VTGRILDELSNQRTIIKKTDRIIRAFLFQIFEVRVSHDPHF